MFEPESEQAANQVEFNTLISVRRYLDGSTSLEETLLDIQESIAPEAICKIQRIG